MTATTADTAPAPQPPQFQAVLARQVLRATELLALERAAIRAVVGPLNVQLVAVQRAAMRTWLAAFGSLDSPGDPIRAAAIATQVRGDLSRIDVSASAILNGYVARAVALGVNQGRHETG